MSTTESSSNYNDLEKQDVITLLQQINKEDQTVALAVQKELQSIENLIEKIVAQMKKGGRLFYIGAGTSGRLGILDASEIPPTYGMDSGHVIGIIAGGDHAIRNPVEFAEDNEEQAWKDLLEFNINDKDVVIGIAASGRTPYVIGGIQKAREKGLITGCITCNANSALAAASEFPIEVIVGPEYVTGSTRMKSGTAQKLVLNMISTTTMIKLGRVRGNKMVDMQLSNQKLVERGTKMIQDETGLDSATAQELLLKYGSVRAAVDHYFEKN